MEQKEIRLNASKRKSLVKDFRKHCESVSTPEKEAFLMARETAKSTNDDVFYNYMKPCVERRFDPADIFGDRSITYYQKKYNTMDAIGTDSCFFMKVIDAPKVLDRYNDEVEKSRHFSFELDGSLSSDYGTRYSGSSHDGKNFAYAYYREDMKAVGLNPDCNIEHEIKNAGDSGSDYGYRRRSDNNPYLSQCRNDNHAWLDGKSGGSDKYQEWKNRYALNIIGTGGCRSRAIPCTELEFAKFEMMISARQDLVTKHHKWIETILAKVTRFEQGIKQMTKFKQVEKFAKHPKVNWHISPEILADKIGMDIVVSIDDLADAIDNISQPKQDNKATIMAWKKARADRLAS